MKAAVLTRYSAPLVVAELEPDPPKFGQVLVRVICSGICGAQLQEIRGEKGGPLPHLLGHEGCGTVESVGDGVTRVKKGDRVVMHWRKGAGIECEFPCYEFNGHAISSGKVVTFAEQAVCSENRLTPVDEDTPKELCALLGCGLSTALGTIEHEAQMKFGESVLVIGCGGLGANLIRAAIVGGAGQVVAVDIHEEKRAMAIELGADWFVCTKERDWPNERELAAVGGFDVIVDTAGAPNAMKLALPLLRGGGRYIMVGQPKPGEAVTMLGAAHMFQGDGKTIKATQGGGFRPEFDIPRYVALWKAGRLRLDGVISHRIPLARINEGVNIVIAGGAGRVLIEM